jgi:hypothetical protein
MSGTAVCRARRGGRTAHRLACFDHISSAGASVCPVCEMAAICRTQGLAVAIDGGVWLRVPAQIYNELADYEPLTAIGRSLMREFSV